MIRGLGYGLLALGVAVLAWTGVTVLRGDPLTSLYTRWQQHQLAQRLQPLDRRWATRPARSPVAGAARARALEAARLRTVAGRYSASLRDGQPFGRIVIPRLGLNMVVVEGTNEGDLEKGPGHYDAESGRATSVPGLGAVVAIAGHRTTFLHPFRHIDALRAGDRIRILMPYGSFTYVVYDHDVVLPTNWRILRRRPFEKLVLTACTPLFSASHRWVVYARLRSASLA
jgi:sortase A